MIIQYVINTLPYFYAGITPPQVPPENVMSLYTKYKEAEHIPLQDQAI